MKKKTLQFSISLAILFFAGMNLNASFDSYSENRQDTGMFVSYYGEVISDETSETLPFASVEALGSNLATVTNIDGEFIIKIPRNSDISKLKISYIGYSNMEISLDDFNRRNRINIRLKPSSASFPELKIRPVDGPAFIEDVLTKVRENYRTEPQRMTGFYRETIKNRRNYVSISEAVVDIYKSSYTNSLQFDQVKIDRGRKSADVKKMDTVLFKLQGGPAVIMLLDLVKNPGLLLTAEYYDIYDFDLENIVSLNDRLHYVISFKQKEYITNPFYNGKLFIDMDNLAITEAEFSLNTENEAEAARLFIKKKPRGMQIFPEKATYRSSYTIQDGKWFFDYARAEVKFKVDWDRKLFNSVYTIMTELAITDKETGVAGKLDNRERFKSSQILAEMVNVYFEEDYWGQYNVIEPDQSIESAIRKLNRKFDRRND